MVYRVILYVILGTVLLFQELFMGSRYMIEDGVRLDKVCSGFSVFILYCGQAGVGGKGRLGGEIVFGEVESI